MVKGESYDVFRDSNVRYLGYANEVGEAFRGIVPLSVVRASYYVAFGYVLADTFDKGSKMWRRGAKVTKVATTVGDALIWQTLASIVIPGIIINRICYYSNLFLNRKNLVPPHARRWVVVGAGLASIPIIITPIDTAVTIFMNNSYRRIF